MEKTVKYIVTRKMQYSTDYVKDYDQLDSFYDLKTARIYLKELIRLIDIQNEVEWRSNNRPFKDAISSHVNKYNQPTGDNYLSVENKIIKQTISRNEIELKGV